MNKKNKFQSIIFDFDGTIVDTLPKTIKIMNQLSEKYGYQKYTGSVDNLRKIRTKEILKKFKIPLYKLPFIYKEVQRILSLEITELEPLKDIKSLLQKLDQSKYLLGIATSNTGDNVQKFLKHHKMNKWPDFIYTDIIPFTKHLTFNKIFKHQQIEPPFCLYVGDEVRDIKAAKKVGMSITAVTWGFNSKQILEQFNPDYLIDTPKQLEKLIFQTDSFI